jgi:hypothetical protein
MNDGQLKDYAALAIQEPPAWKSGDRLWTVPMKHPRWTRMVPTVWRDGRWGARSMLWVNKDLDAEQIPTPSPDVVAARLRLSGRDILLVSVYVQCYDAEVLLEICQMIDRTICEARSTGGQIVDVIVAGDFNRHDQLWGGDAVSLDRQGEADPIIDLMNEHSLRSMLPRGTKTWHARQKESTIDLVLASEDLVGALVKCTIHETDHGSDHQAVETWLDVAMPRSRAEPRLLFKNAPWKEMNEKVASRLRLMAAGGSVQQQTDRLMVTVLETVHELTPKAKPSAYAKRWWTADLTQLRRIHTYWRNRAKTSRRAGQTEPELERLAKDASKQYHDAIRRQKKSHWNDFLADDRNIWTAAKYLHTEGGAAFDRVPQLTRADGTCTTNGAEQAEELLSTFFPPLPEKITEEGLRAQRAPVSMPEVTMEEVEAQQFRMKPWKAPGEDGLPIMVWRQVWPAVKHRVLELFRTSVEDGTLPTQWRHAKNCSTQETRQGRLHHRHGMETDLAAVDIGEGPRSGDRRKDLICGGDVRAATNEPLWGSETPIGRASTCSTAGAYLQSVAQQTSCQSRQL